MKLLPVIVIGLIFMLSVFTPMTDGESYYSIYWDPIYEEKGMIISSDTQDLDKIPAGSTVTISISSEINDLGHLTVYFNENTEVEVKNVIEDFKLVKKNYIISNISENIIMEVKGIIPLEIKDVPSVVDRSRGLDAGSYILIAGIASGIVFLLAGLYFTVWKERD